jgi:3-oxoadipate enol-lactonase
MGAVQFTPGPIRIAFERYGSGPLVIFLHGIGGNRSNWIDQLQSLRGRFCVVACDARGYGDSDDPPGSLAFSDFADDLQRLIDHLGARKAHVVGLSMGGLVAQDFHARYRDCVASLTLVATSDGSRSVTPEEMQEFLRLRLEPLDRGLGMAHIAPPLVEVLAGPDATTTVRNRLLESLLALRVESYKKALRAIVTVDFRDALHEIAVPVLVVNGGADRVTPRSESRTLTTEIPDAEVAVIERAGHLVNIEKPAAFNAVLRSFLERHAQLATWLRE